MQLTAQRLEELVKFSHRVATKYARRWDPEYLSIGHTCLLRALKTFDEARGVPLEGWIAFLVRRGIQYYWRKHRREKLQTHLFWDKVPSQQDEVWKKFEALDELSAFDREVAKLYWLEGMTVEQIAYRFPECSVKRLGRYMGTLKAKLWAIREKIREHVQ